MSIDAFCKPSLSRRLLAGSSALGFYVWCMMLPLVGRSGSSAPHAHLNFLTSLGLLLLSFTLALVAGFRLRAAGEKIPRPLRMLGSLQLLCLMLLLAGAFKL